MSLSSLSFIFIYFPFLLLVYYLPLDLIKNNRKIIMLFASIGLYAFAEPVYVFLLVASVLFNYFCGKRIVRRTSPKTYLVLAVVTDIAVLLGFKYINYFMANLGFLFRGGVGSIIIPIGLSYYTFQEISFIAECYKNKDIKEIHFIDVAFYVTNLFRIVSGPIAVFDYNNEQKKLTTEGIDYDRSVRKLICGLSKKVIIADSLSTLVVFCFATDDRSVLLAWTGAIAYTFQLYYDFSGYSDLAIGMAGLFGIHIDDNFNYPYIATSVSDFWKRWHISLTKWFTKYVYIPLGGSRVSTARHIVNLWVVWLCTGIWHGSKLTFIIWGMLYFLFQLAEKYKVFDKFLKYKAIGHVYTLFIVINCWVIFNSSSVSSALSYLTSMYSISNNALLSVSDLEVIGKYIVPLLLGCVFAFPIVNVLGETSKKNRFFRCVYNLCFLLIYVVCIALMLGKGFSVPLYAGF